MIKITNTVESSIPAYELKDSQIGVITRGPSGNYVGLVVQRCGDYMFALGSIHYWSDIRVLNMIFVKVLPNGTTLTVEENE